MMIIELPRGLKIDVDNMTNADKIRAMSDEELADFLYFYGGSAPSCNRVEMAYDYKSCRDCWLDWLKEEATE